MQLHPEDGGSVVVRNAGILPHHYMLSQPIFALKIAAAWSSETLASYRIPTWCHNPEEQELILKSRNFV
jgi:hypothetical protein